jgi:hypothetical protein
MTDRGTPLLSDRPTSIVGFSVHTYLAMNLVCKQCGWAVPVNDKINDSAISELAISHQRTAHEHP